MNIPKYLSQQRILSRREAEKFILAGKIKVNGIIVKNLATRIDPEIDKVEVIGDIPEKTTLIFHKPRGISSSKVASEGKNIFDLIPEYKNLNTIGRLDKESEGLILLTDDGVLANLITGKEHLIEKEYLVEVQEDISQSQINALEKGMVLEDGPTLPTKAKIINPHIFSIILKEGRNHQIRRMANKVRLTIAKLKRIRVGDIKLNNLPPGKYQKMSQEQVASLKQIS